MKKRDTVCIRIDPEIWKEAKKRSLELDLTVGKFVEAAIIHEIQKNGR